MQLKMSEKKPLLASVSDHTLPSNNYGCSTVQAKQNTQWQVKGVPLGWFLAACTCSVVSGLDVVGGSLIYGLGIQLMIDATDMSTDQDRAQVISGTIKLTVFTFVLTAVIFGATYVQNLLWRYLSEERLRKASVECFEVLLAKPISWWDHEHSGKINQDVNKQILDIRAGLGEKIGMLIQNVTSMVTVTLFVMYICWYLIFCIALVLLMGHYGSVLIKKTGAASRQTAQKERRNAAHISSETITHMRTVHAYNAQNIQLSKTLYRLIIQNQITIGEFSMMTNCFNRFATAIQSVKMLQLEVKKALEAIDKMEETKNQAKYVRSGSNSEAAILKRLWTKCPPVHTLRMENINFTYPSEPDVKVLTDFNLILRKNETVALIGQTGSGKSTVINLLLGFYSNYDGKILINDHQELADVDHGSWRSRLGVVSQQCVLLDTTVIENIRAGRDHITREQCVEACKQANAHEFILSLDKGYDTEIQSGNISGGQQQRLVIARALVGDPDVLVLDEPTASLDNQNEMLVEQAIDRAKVNRATLLISHSLSLAESADRVIVLSNGVTVEHDDTQTSLYMSMQNENETKEEEESLSMGNIVQPVKRFQSIQSVLYSHSLKTRSVAGTPISDKVRPPFVWLMTCSLFSFLGSFATPVKAFIALGGIYALYTKDVTAILFMCFFAFVAGVVFGTVTFCMTYSYSVLSEKFSARLHGVIMKRIVQLPIEAFDTPEFCPSAVLAVLFEHNDKTKAGLGYHLSQVLSSLLSLLISTLIVCVLDWRLLPIGVIAIPLISGGQWMRLRALQLSKEKPNIAAKVRYEAFQKIRTIRFLNLETNFSGQYESLLKQESSDTLTRASRFEGIAVAYSKVGMFTFSFFSLLYAVWAVLQLNMSSFAIIVTRIIFGQASMAMGVTITYMQNFKQAKESYKIVKDFAEMDLTDHDPRNGGKSLNVDGSVAFSNVNFYYSTSEKRILKGITFETKPKALTVIVGRSGSGKSTCLQLIERFYEVSGGQIKISRCDIHEHNLQFLRSKIAWLSQNPVLFDVSVAENIKYGSSIDDYERMEECARLACAHDFIMQLPQGYDTPAGEGGLRFSGGQRQRIALARALFRRPKLLLLDEATSALDVHTEQAVLSNLRDKQMSIILVTHRLVAAEMADQVLVMKRGKLVQIGTHDSLCDEPGYYQQLYLGSNMSEAVNTETD